MKWCERHQGEYEDQYSECPGCKGVPEYVPKKRKPITGPVEWKELPINEKKPKVKVEGRGK